MAAILPYSVLVMIVTIAIQAAAAERFNGSYRGSFQATTVESSSGVCPSGEVTEEVLGSIDQDVRVLLRNLTLNVSLE